MSTDIEVCDERTDLITNLNSAKNYEMINENDSSSSGYGCSSTAVSVPTNQVLVSLHNSIKSVDKQSSVIFKDDETSSYSTSTSDILLWGDDASDNIFIKDLNTSKSFNNYDEFENESKHFCPLTSLLSSVEDYTSTLQKRLDGFWYVI